MQLTADNWPPHEESMWVWFLKGWIWSTSGSHWPTWTRCLLSVFATWRSPSGVSVYCYLYANSPHTHWVINHNWVWSWEPDSWHWINDDYTNSISGLMSLCVSLIRHKVCVRPFAFMNPYTPTQWKEHLHVCAKTCGCVCSCIFGGSPLSTICPALPR